MVTEVRHFWGFTNFHHKFIYKFTQVIQPWYKLISGGNAWIKSKTIEWNVKCEGVFRKLKDICTSTPILAYADFTKPFKLHTDACTMGLGTIHITNRMGLTT